LTEADSDLEAERCYLSDADPRADLTVEPIVTTLDMRTWVRDCIADAKTDEDAETCKLQYTYALKDEAGGWGL